MHQGVMSPDVTIFAALFAGLISFLSPCVLPLVPPYLVYLAGTSLERLADGDPRTGSQRQTVAAAALFVAGFSTVFVSLGASASVFGSLLRAYSYRTLDDRGRSDHRNGASLPQRVSDFHGSPAPNGSMWRNRWGCGALMRWGWHSHSAGRRASARSLQRSWRSRHPKPTVGKGAGLLAVYSLGLGVPFMLAAFAVEPFAKFLTRFRRHLVVRRAGHGCAVDSHRHRVSDRLDHHVPASGCWRRSPPWAGLVEAGAPDFDRHPQIALTFHA